MRNQLHRRAEQGYSLAELTTAIAVFVVVMTAALLVYDRSNRVFSSNAQSADMQQTTRVAYEKLLQDVRLAGFDYKRAGVPTSAYPVWKDSTNYAVGQMILASPNNGYIYRASAITTGTSGTNPPTFPTAYGATVDDSGVTWTNAGRLAAAFDQPDEQIEYAWSSAITVRGNYDYDIPDDPAGSTRVHYDHGREMNLESSQFPVITTGNDEIVTYGLVSNAPGAANSDTISFYADVNNGGNPSRTAYPGGNAERRIDITGVDLSNANPPYTLYRFTLAADGSVVRTPLADNIRSLNFQYWQDQKATIPLNDLTGNPITDVGGGGRYNPATATTVDDGNRPVRRSIRAVTVSLVGMSTESNPNYNDGDTVMPHNRKMALATTIVPRNLGIRTMPLSSVQIPPPPTSVNVCVGYCGIALVTWQPGDPSTLSSTGSNGDESYSIVWDTHDVNNGGTFQNWMPAGQLTTYAADLTQKDLTQDYYFRVAATNNVGTAFSSVVGPVSLKNATKPATTGLVTTGTITNGIPQISLSWSAPQTNASGAPSCTPTASTPPYSMLPAEQQGFRIYRNTTGNTPTSTDLYSDIGGTGQTSDGAGHWTFVDRSIVICQRYYYWVQVCEWCQAATQNASGLATDGSSDLAAANNSVSTAAPQAPATVSATGTCDFNSNQCTGIRVTWSKVTQDQTTPTPITINVDEYAVYRQTRKNDPTTGTIISDYQQISDTTGYLAQTTPTFTETATLRDHDPSDFAPYYYNYKIVAKSNCGDSPMSSAASIPASCPTQVSTTASNSYGGDGSSATPFLGPTAINLVASGSAITNAYYSLDGANLAAMPGSSPLVSTSSPVPWKVTTPDNYHGATHYLIFFVSVNNGTCYQRLPTVYYQETTDVCHLTSGANAVTVNNPSGNTSSWYDNGWKFKIQNLIGSSAITVTNVTASVAVPASNAAGGVTNGNNVSLTPVMWASTPFQQSSDAAPSASAPITKPQPCPGNLNSNSTTTCSFSFVPPTTTLGVAGSSSDTQSFTFFFNHKGNSAASAPTISAFTSVQVSYTINSCASCGTKTCTIYP